MRDGKIFLHQADTTLVALDAKTGKVVWSVKTGDPGKGETGTGAPMVVKDKVYVGVSGGEFGVRGWVTAYATADGKQIWRAYSEGPDTDLLFDPQKTTVLGKPVGADSSLKTWEGDQWKIGGGDTWGWYSYDPALNLIYYGSRQPLDLEPEAAARRQQVVDDDLRPRCRYRHGEVGLSDDAARPVGLRRRQRNDPGRPADRRQDASRRWCISTATGFGYTLNRATGELLVAAKYDPAVNWTTGVDMDKSSANYGRPTVVAKFAPGRTART